MFATVALLGSAAQASSQYSYDQLHRLEAVTYESGTTITYQYDELGNRTRRIVVLGSCAVDGTPCDDGIFCNGEDTCSGGSCSVHAGNPCSGPDGDANCSESCDEGTDACTAADPDGSACDDGLLCTAEETCSSGSCATGAPLDCNDGDPCTIDSCNEISGCVNSPDPVCTASSFTAEYFSNPTLSGTPTLVRNDGASLFALWPASGSPDPLIPADGFSARWTGQFSFAEGLHSFTVRADDGVVLYVDGVPLIDQWIDQAATSYGAEIWLTSGAHTITVEYYENAGDSVLELGWAPSNSPLPIRYLAEIWDTTGTGSSPPLPGGGVSPDVTRYDAEIDFDFGAASPEPGIPNDHFLIRWNGDVWFAGGNYRISITSDDGSRFYLDNVYYPELDHWFDQDGSTVHTHTLTIPQGFHNVKLEYYENGGSAKVKLELPAVGQAVPSLGVSGPWILVLVLLASTGLMARRRQRLSRPAE